MQDISQHNYRNEHQQVIVQENTNTVFVNREKILIQKQASEESSDSLKPLLNSEEETFAVQSSSTTYNSITSSRSSTSTSTSSSPVTKLFPNTCSINMPDENRKISTNSTFNEAIENYLTPLSVPYTPPPTPLPLPLSSPPRIETKAIVHNTNTN